MEVNTECAHCGKETPIKEGEDYVVVSSDFELMNDKNYFFYLSAGYTMDGAKEFVTKVRMMGHFAVMAKLDKVEGLENPLQFKELLEIDEYE